ncbi:MAG: tRNA (adenosine(37)-N6)-dimethylallyltransferase MiaA [Gemmatimonadetes bacterium]|nr:tRNA (adenosine(37)-N6)-dimethylallyltransferase MiaA [Gemmatimonadota bacterium]MYB60951.1 tRNA (adenosine(37)-N6)-dimethylallyltransferase MiaA [Gemmatimonadota bacterium]
MTSRPMASGAADSRPIPVLVGPTGVGKTAVGIELARRFGAEIVSADSRQVYRYMDIGTAKPTAEEQAAAPHHLIDVVDPDVRFSAGEYGRLSREAIQDLADREVPALVVGGAGLYIKALAGGLFDAPEIPRALRQRLANEYRSASTDALHERLSAVDPVSAARIHVNDRQRIERALEVHDATGATLTSWFERPVQSRSRSRGMRLVGLRRDRAALYARTDARVEKMIESGLEAEVRALMDRGYGPGTHAMSTFGYAEMLRYIGGELELKDAVSAIQQRSRQYAKRQLTWFRQTEGIVWITVDEGEDPAGTCEKIIRSFPDLLF